MQGCGPLAGSLKRLSSNKMKDVGRSLQMLVVAMLVFFGLFSTVAVADSTRPDPAAGRIAGEVATQSVDDPTTGAPVVPERPGPSSRAPAVTTEPVRRPPTPTAPMQELPAGASSGAQFEVPARFATPTEPPADPLVSSPSPITAPPLVSNLPETADAGIQATILVSEALTERAELIVTGIGGTVVSKTSLVSFDKTILVYRVARRDSAELENRLNNEVREAVVAPRTIYRLSAGAPRLYGKALIGWPDAALCEGVEGARIGVLDGPLNGLRRPVGAQVKERLFGVSGDNPRAAAHAAAVVGLLIGAQGFADAGLAEGTEVRHATVFRDEGQGTRAEVDQLAIALDWLLGEEVRVINLSFAGEQNDVFAALLEILAERGIVLVGAVGNDGTRSEPETAFPASHPGVLGVTAVDMRMKVASDANQGAFVAFAAPGVDVYAPAVGGGGRYVSGTSFSAPFVSALMSRQIGGNSRLSPDILALILRDTVIDLGAPGQDNTFGWGLIQAPDGLCFSAQ